MFEKSYGWHILYFLPPTLFLCEKSIARIEKPWKCIPNLLYKKSNFNNLCNTWNYDNLIIHVLGSVFKGFRCVQSISHMNIGDFWKKFWKFITKKRKSTVFLAHPVKNFPPFSCHNSDNGAVLEVCRAERPSLL